MKESQERSTLIEDIDGDIDDGTIMRFVEFSYTGDYTVPDIEHRGEERWANDAVEELSEAQSPPPVSNGVEPQKETEPTGSFCEENMGSLPSCDYGAVSIRYVEANEYEPEPEATISSSIRASYSSNKRKKDKKKRCIDGTAPISSWVDTLTLHDVDVDIANSPPREEVFIIQEDTIAQRKQNLWAGFVSKATLKNTAKSWEPRKPNTSNDSQYTFDLLCHACLYVFSSRYESPALADLAIQKLRLTLSRFDPREDTSAIVELLRYTYFHTQPYSRSRDRLRALVMEYTVCHLEKIVGNEQFKELVKKNGDFAVDVLTGAMSRLE